MLENINKLITTFKEAFHTIQNIKFKVFVLSTIKILFPYLKYFKNYTGSNVTRLQDILFCQNLQ